MEGEKILADRIFNESPVGRIYRERSQLTKEKSSSIKMGE